jgi:hypothetical protein
MNENISGLAMVLGLALSYIWAAIAILTLLFSGQLLLLIVVLLLWNVLWPLNFGVSWFICYIGLWILYLPIYIINKIFG